MHNIGSTSDEFGQEYQDEFGYEDIESDAEYGMPGEVDSEVPLSPEEVDEFAEELLSVTSEAELDEFFRRLIGRVAGAASRFIRSPVGQALRGSLAQVVRTGIPTIATALGPFTGPFSPVVSALGTSLGNIAGNLIAGQGGVQQEDTEFEAARIFTRAASVAIRRAATAPADAPPQRIATSALVSAMRRYVPGLPSGTNVSPTIIAGTQRRSGRWIRRGRRIILLGV